MEMGGMGGPVNGGETLAWVEPLPRELMDARQTKDEGLPPPLPLPTVGGIPSGVLNGDAWRLKS